MFIDNLIRKLEDTLGIGQARQDKNAVPDVIEKSGEDLGERIVLIKVPEKFKADVEALERFAGCCGDYNDDERVVRISLQDLLKICPRERRRVDAYKSLQTFLKNEMGVELIITSQKTKGF